MNLQRPIATIMTLIQMLTASAALSAAVPTNGECPPPALARDPQAQYVFSGQVGNYIDSLSEHWLKRVVGNNPRLLDDLKNRNHEPFQTLEPWAGEFLGKHLSSAAEIYRITRDPQIKEQTDALIEQMATLQAPNGYLGVFPEACELTGQQPQGDGHQVTCDAWNHYHIVLGMVLWHRETGNPTALDVARRIGDRLCAQFLGQPRRLYDAGPREFNYATLHAMTLLYEQTGEQRYMDLAKQVVDTEFTEAAPPDFPRGMDFVGRALEGQEYFQNEFPAGPRWECMHTILGVAQLYWLTGNAGYARATEHIWWSLVKTDRYNNGGWGSMEQAFGRPYQVRPKELCCGVAWLALGSEVLKMTADPIVADEMELCFINFVQAYQSRTGIWAAYNVPPDGRITAAMPGQLEKEPPLNTEICCCTVNGPRGFGLLTEWALLTNEGGLTLNYYGPSALTAHVGEVPVTLTQWTDYPRTGAIRLEVAPEQPARFALRLRIPHWSRRTSVLVNGERVQGVKAGQYLSVERTWTPGDVIHMELDMGLHLWAGEDEVAGRAAFYRGPVLLALPRPRPLDALQFTGQWSTYFSARHLPYVDLYGSNTPGDTVAFDFEGTRVAWTYNTLDNCGRAQVKLDGQVVDEVDLYARFNANSLFDYASDEPNLFLSATWERDGLAPGKHRLELTVLPEKNEKSSDRWVNVREIVSDTEDPLFDFGRLDQGALVSEPGATVAVELNDASGKPVRLVDFDSAAEDCAPYISWLRMTGLEPVPFSHANPTRSRRVAD